MQYLLSVIPYVGSEIDNAHPNERGSIEEKFRNRDDADARLYHLIETAQIESASFYVADKRYAFGRKLLASFQHEPKRKNVIGS